MTDKTPLFDDAQPVSDDAVVTENLVIRADGTEGDIVLLGTDPFESIDYDDLPDDIDPHGAFNTVDRETVVMDD